MSVNGGGTVITGNVFDGNQQGAGGFGAAIGGNNSSPIIQQNVFQNNSCDGQFLSGVVSFVNTSSPRIVNNIFQDNPCRAINMTLPSGSLPQVINNTIVRNVSGVRVDRRIPTNQQVYRNNLIVGNQIGLEVDFGGESFNPTWENNLVLIMALITEELWTRPGKMETSPLSRFWWTWITRITICNTARRRSARAARRTPR
jgi:hypothetical protein